MDSVHRDMDGPGIFMRVCEHQSAALYGLRFSCRSPVKDGLMTTGILAAPGKGRPLNIPGAGATILQGERGRVPRH
ncbi:MAG: hypothetical protein ABSG91_06050 [Syntrophobacteraceae bacterium]